MMESDDLRRTPLNQSQRAFCCDPEKRLRLLAPAGSGKTLSILWRCYNIFEVAGPTKPRFLIFTFTRGARDELVERIRGDAYFARMQGNVEVSTLNSYGLRRLRKSRNKLKMLIDARDIQNFVENTLQGTWNNHPKIKELITGSRRPRQVSLDLMAAMDLMMSIGFRHDLKDVRSSFDKHVKWLKDNGLSRYFLTLQHGLEDLGIVERGSDRPDEEILENFFKFWCDACRSMEASAMITFEGQKYFYLIELKRLMDNGSFAPPSRRFDHILVDEFQDINILDMNLLKAIAKGHGAGLTIIGDDDQAIFEWRGASPDFIVNPDRFLGRGYTTYVLDINYRSPANIVDCSQSLIRNNKRRVEKTVEAANQQRADIVVQHVPNIEASVQYVSSVVRTYLGDKKNMRNIALIGRKRGQIVPYQIVFAAEGIPFYAAEDLQIFMSRAFEDLIEILTMKSRQRSGTNTQMAVIDDLLLLCDKVFRFPLSKSDRGELKQRLIQKGPKDHFDALRAIWEYEGKIKNQGGERFAKAIRPILESPSVSSCITAISENLEGMSKDYGKSLEDIFYSDPPFLYIAEYAARYDNRFAEFVDDLMRAKSTLSRTAPDDSEEKCDNRRRPLHLMTALRAKGKEFDAVVILDCNDDIWPSKLSKDDDALEAERRLFYVAMTRARKKLHIVVDDKILGERKLPSPFLKEAGL